eukprot:TRINITY_DN2292_c0_g1_i4.p1 TRINITY_DN2292_c0_g1~~TRINITY_DN2292_c0_g1_i4.p1  ORF type:complete len:923 (-),score=165.27 TRINITY_DN2292_c0_g1_i4:261-2774(-)
MTCWGDNNYEQLGLGTALRQYSPPSTTIALGSVPVHSVFGGASHICALLVDGDVKCWGKNGAGELGIGSKINVGDQPGEMPPVSAILAPILMSVPPVVYVPLQRLTLVGSGFGNSAENVTVNFESSNSSISANCPLVFLALFRLECIPPAFTDGIPFQLVFVGRKGFGTSNALGPVRILPSDPVLVSMAPTSGEFGTLLSISVFGISGANETTVGFVPASAGAVCSPGKCNGTVRAVDFDAQTAIVEVPDLPAVGAYFVVVRTPRGVSQSNVTFTFCSENCAECTAPRSSTEVECTLCRIGWSFNISGSTCIKYCGSGEFSDRSNSSYRCRKCDTSCAECQGPESDQCTVCHTGIVVESVSERGIKCGTACKEGFFFNNGTCYCPPGSFYLAEQKNCERCPPNSFSEYRVDQNGPSSHSCTACPLDRTTRGYDGQTSPSACLCKSDTYPSFGGAKCIACTSLSGRVRCNGQQSVNGTTVASAGLEVAAGYWLTTDAKYLRNPDSSEHWFVVVQCPVRGACTGGSEEASCADGYTGPACGLCARGYGRLGEQCAKCPNQSVSGFLVFFILALVCVACMAVVYFFTRAKKDDDSASEGSAMQRLKIAITHLQILGLIGGFASDWPETLVNVFSIPTAVATLSSGTDNIAIDCSIQPSLYDRAVVLFFAAAYSRKWCSCWIPAAAICEARNRSAKQDCARHAGAVVRGTPRDLPGSDAAAGVYTSWTSEPGQKRHECELRRSVVCCIAGVCWAVHRHVRIWRSVGCVYVDQAGSRALSVFDQRVCGGAVLLGFGGDSAQDAVCAAVAVCVWLAAALLWKLDSARKLDGTVALQAVQIQNA